MFHDIFHIEMQDFQNFHHDYLENNKSNSINFDDKFHTQNKNYVYNEYSSSYLI
jgi:hypothetical protein